MDGAEPWVEILHLRRFRRKLRQSPLHRQHHLRGVHLGDPTLVEVGELVGNVAEALGRPTWHTLRGARKQVFRNQQNVTEYNGTL